MMKIKPEDIPLLYKKHKSIAAISRATGVPETTVQNTYHKARELGLVGWPKYNKKSYLAVQPKDLPKLYEKYGSVRGIGRALDIPNGSLQKIYRKAVAQGIMQHLPMGRKKHSAIKRGTVKAQGTKNLVAKKGERRCYILTSAQNNTNIHKGTWENLLAYSKETNAEILVSAFVYSKRGLGTRNDKAKIEGKRDQDDIWYDPKVVPYLFNERAEIAPGLVFCGELNISPTATRPLSGLEVYTGRSSMIVPHVKIALEAVATIGGDGAKLNYTTGTVTLRNYIKAKAGFKAEFHHCFGALFVEIDENGAWWARQLHADDKGTIHDLDVKIENGVVTRGNRVEAITCGDIHVDNVSEIVRRAVWGEGGVVSRLRPKYQFLHDLLDFYRRNHHSVKDPYRMFKRHVQGRESVKDELLDVGLFLMEVSSPDTKTIVVNSNHDRALMRWLKEQNGRADPINAEFWSWLNSEIYSYIREHAEEPEAFYLALRKLCPRIEKEANVILLEPHKSFVICDKHDGGIECGLHGDQGANGSRGTLRSFSRQGRRSNTGHDHTGGICDGAYRAGTFSTLDLEYVGPLSSWTNSFIVTYPNSKRAIVTIYGGKAYA